jgi:glycerophosphoryl diester phosphodiesterase
MTKFLSSIVVRLFAVVALSQVSLVALSAPTRAEQIRDRLDSADRNYVFVVMHRGDWRNAPENSVDAILGSIEKGADIVELDVAKTKDGEYVLVHDDRIDRISNGKGKVKDLTLDEIRKFRLKGTDGKTITEYKILTLKEAFDLTRGKILVNLDKFARDPKGIADFVMKHGMEKEVVLKGSFSPESLRRKMGASYGYIADGTLFYMPIIWIDDGKAKAAFNGWQNEPKRPGAYELCFGREKSLEVLNILKEGQASGAPRIWINTLWDSLCAGHTDERGFNGDRDGSWGWCLDQGATMIQTDRPVELIRYLEEKGRRTSR